MYFKFFSGTPSLGQYQKFQKQSAEVKILHPETALSSIFSGGNSLKLILVEALRMLNFIILPHSCIFNTGPLGGSRRTIPVQNDPEIVPSCLTFHIMNFVLG